MTNKKKVDIAVIGAGPGGYVAAIKAAQMGRRVVLIEKKDLGGTCLNVGCIPSKALLSNAQVLQKIKNAKNYGIEVENVSFDYAKMKKRKDEVVSQIKQSLEKLIRSNMIEIIRGNASFLSPYELKIKGKDNELISAEKIIIATGSKPMDIPAFSCDHERICNSTSILNLEKLPKSLAIIGGGYIGCEFASLFSELGVKVTIIEALHSIIQPQGKIISAHLTRSFIKRGISILTDKVVEAIDKDPKGLLIHLKGGQQIESEMAIVAVGRKLNTENLDLEKAGLSTGSKGEIEVNETLETKVAGIYAIGDITAKAMLAHTASHQGIIAASNACGIRAQIHYDAIPAVIFTHPEIGMVGLTEEEARKEGYHVSVGTFPFQALGKSIASMETEGFVQIIADKETKAILGAQVVGHDASVLIAEMALAINNELTLDCIIDTIHAHPTVPEAWLEAALLANETPMHFPPKMKN